MKISPHHDPQMDKVHSLPSTSASKNTPASESRKPEEDKVSLSPRAAEVRKFAKLAKALPDVREDKVKALRKQIKSGEYKVPGKLVADSIVNSTKDTS